MINLNEIMQAAHGGDAVNSLAEQFDITPHQATEAVQALLPGISMGLQQQMSSGGLNQILGHLATQQNVAAWQDSRSAYSDETMASGADALNSLFGGDATGALAENAAEHSSLQAELLQSMLPIITAMVMGGLFKSIAAKGGLGGMFGQAPAAPAPAPQTESGGGGIGDILGQMTGRQAPPQAPQSGGGGIGDILGQMTGGGQQQPHAAPQGGGGLGDLLGQLAGGQRGGAASQPGGLGGGGLGDLLGSLLGGGQKPGGAPQGGGGLGGLLGSLLGGGQPGAQGQGAPGGGNNQLQAGLEQLNNMFGHGTQVSPQQKSGLDGLLGQLLGGGRR